MILQMVGIGSGGLLFGTAGGEVLLLSTPVFDLGTSVPANASIYSYSEVGKSICNEGYQTLSSLSY